MGAMSWAWASARAAFAAIPAAAATGCAPGRSEAYRGPARALKGFAHGRGARSLAPPPGPPWFVWRSCLLHALVECLPETPPGGRSTRCAPGPRSPIGSLFYARKDMALGRIGYPPQVSRRASSAGHLHARCPIC
jgi:hypothetical protein